MARKRNLKERKNFTKGGRVRFDSGGDYDGNYYSEMVIVGILTLPLVAAEAAEVPVVKAVPAEEELITTAAVTILQPQELKIPLKAVLITE